MVRGFNKVVIMGNLTRDPEVRYTNSNRALARFSVAVNRVWKDREGRKQEAADYIPVVVWGPQAENCEKYLAKGRPVLVEGRIQTRSYEAKDGSGKRYVTEVQAENVVFLGSGSGQRDGPTEHSIAKSNGYAPDPPAEPMNLNEAETEEESDIPF